MKPPKFKGKEHKGKYESRRTWTPEERRYLIWARTKTDLTMKEISAHLGRTLKSVERKWEMILAGQGEIENEGPPPEFEEETIEIREDGNEMIIDSRTRGRITTLDDLLDAAKVDRLKWRVDKWIANKWEVGAKFGVKGMEELVIEPLWQVKAWLVRLQPIALEPVVSPIKVIVRQLDYQPTLPAEDLKRALIMSDIQHGFKKSLRTAMLTPFHDRKALDVVLQIASDYRIDFQAWIGDILDLADWSDKYTREPNFYWTTQPSLIEACWWMTQFRLLDPEAKAYMIEGNHEKRMPDQILKHLKEGFGLRSVDDLDLPPAMSIPRLLALHELGIEYIDAYPNGEVWLNDYIACEHGAIARARPGGTVSAMIVDIDETRITGHDHRVEMCTKTIHGREGTRTVSVWSIGCLCRLDGIVPAKKAKVNWQQAFAMVEYFEDGRPDHNIDVVMINNGKALYNGKLYKARDEKIIIEELTESTKELYGDNIGWRY